MQKEKINKYIEFGTTKLKILYKEKKFYKNNHRIKYILERSKNSKDLIVILSGIPRPGLKARYNYNRTLRNVKANKLYILDDFGYDQRGCFYLGKNKDFKIQEICKDLINEVKKKLNIKNTIYAGSSKGGFAALYFGLQDKGSTIIAGGPQYILGNHLKASERYLKNTLPYILGNNYNENDIQYLNDLIKKHIYETNGNDCNIYIHYSNKEFTYERHVKFLIEDLKKNNIQFEEDVEEYETHPEIAFYFPKFLINTLKKVI